MIRGRGPHAERRYGFPDIPENPNDSFKNVVIIQYIRRKSSFPL
jgi:hypothetical protein